LKKLQKWELNQNRKKEAEQKAKAQRGGDERGAQAVAELFEEKTRKELTKEGRRGINTPVDEERWGVIEENVLV